MHEEARRNIIKKRPGYMYGGEVKGKSSGGGKAQELSQYVESVVE